MKMHWIVNDKHQSKAVTTTESGLREELNAGGREVTSEEWDAFKTKAMIAEEKGSKTNANVHLHKTAPHYYAVA